MTETTEKLLDHSNLSDLFKGINNKFTMVCTASKLASALICAASNPTLAINPGSYSDADKHHHYDDKPTISALKVIYRNGLDQYLDKIMNISSPPVSSSNIGYSDKEEMLNEEVGSSADAEYFDSQVIEASATNVEDQSYNDDLNQTEEDYN